MFTEPRLSTLVRRLAADAEAVPDAELLDRFAQDRDQAAFELLVWRHGALVWGVCRRALAPDWHAAEDACQATFVALATHAARLRDRQAVAGWLHRVAVRTSLDLIASRRKTQPLSGSDREPFDPGRDPARTAADRETRRLLDAGVNRLPDKLRVPFVLCALQGRSNAEVAAVLGCPVGTVESRLTRARQQLRGWLTARGVAPAVGVVAAVTVPAAARAAMKRAVVAGAVEPSVRALAERAVGLTLAAKVRAVAAVVGGVIVAAALGLGLAGGGEPGPADNGPMVEGQPASKPRTDAEGFPLPDGVIARLGSARLRHGGWVHDISFAADGKHLASVGSDGTVRVWDAATGGQVLVVRRPKGAFERVTFANEGKVIVAFGHDDTKGCDLWRIDRMSGTVTERLPVAATRPERPAIRFSRDGSRLAVGTADTHQLLVIDTATANVVWTADLGKEAVGGVAIAADGRTFAAATDAGKVHLFDAAGKPTGAKTAEAKLTNVALAPDGKVVVAFSTANDQLMAWDGSVGEPAWKHTGSADYSLTFSPDGRTLSRSAYAHTACALVAADGKAGATFESMVEATATAFRPDGKVVACGTISGTICLFDAETGKSLPPTADPPYEVRWMRFSPDGRTLFGWSADWFAWDVASGRQRRITHTGWNYGEPLSSDGKLTARGVWYSGALRAGAKDDGSRFEVRDAATGEVKHSWSGRGFRGVGWNDFTPDGKTVVSGSSYDGTVSAWDVETGKELFRGPGLKGLSQYHAFSADSRVLVTGISSDAEEHTVHVLDLTGGKEMAKLRPGAGVTAVAASGDGRRVAACTYTNAGGQPDARQATYVWDVASGKEMARFPQEGDGGFVALSPDGRTAAVAARWKGEVHVWEVESGRERFVFRHGGEITGLLFAPDGRTLAAASKEAPVYLWDLTGDKVGPPPAWDFKAADRVWDDLSSTDAVKAFAAVRCLRADPAAAVPFLRDRSKRPAAPDPAVLKRLFVDLDSSDFETRQKATTILADFDDVIRTALETELTAAHSAEVRARVKGLLDRLTGPTPARLRLIRAVEAVEGMSTPESRGLLETWASGGHGSTLETDAKAALARQGR